MAFSERLGTSRWLAPVILAGFCAFLFFYGLNAGELYRNETLRAIIARDMLRSGNWIVPTLYGEPIFTKPPGMYWAIALCSLPFGEVTEWTARLPSALAASVCVFLVYWLFSMLLDRRAGLVAGLVLPMSAFWLERATSAEIDMVQVAWVMAAIVFFLRAMVNGDGTLRVPGEFSTPSVPSPFWLVAALVCVAGGTLTKWTAPVFFYGMAIPFLCWRGRLSLLLSWRHFLAVTLGVMLVASWISAAIVQTGWDSFYVTVSREAFNHLASGHRKAYLAEALLHPFKALGAMLPWSAVGLIALWPSFYRGWDEKGRFLLQALHCWVWPSLLFWSLMSDHSLRHSAPLFPALSGLGAMAWVGWTRQQSWRAGGVSPPSQRVCRESALSEVLEVGTNKGGHCTFADSGDLRPPLANEGGGDRARWARRLMASMLAAWMVLKVLYIEVAVPMRDAQRQTRAKAALLASLVPANAVLYLMKVKDEGIMFYFGRPVVRVAGPHALPSTVGPLFCILTEEEWHNWSGRPATPIEHLQDAQGDSMVLVQLD